MSIQKSSLHLKRSIFSTQYSSSYIALNMECVSGAIAHIFKRLDGKSRGTVRLVCHTWKKIMDDNVGLFLRLDDREENNASFVRLVKMERLILQNVDAYEKYISFKYPETLAMLCGIGPVPPKWFRDNVLLKCQGLTRLELTGKFLFSDLCYGCCCGGPAPIIIPNLRSFVLSIDYGACQEYLQEKKPQGKLQVVWGAIVGCQLNDLYFLRETVDANVSYLLNTVRSLRLRLCYIFVDPIHFEDPKDTYTFEWKKDPLEIFLEYHRSVLERLYLPSFERSSRELQGFRIFPESLKTLELSLQQKGRHRQYSFSEKILTYQRRLEELRLQKSYIGEFQNSDIPHLSVLVSQNDRTLTYVHLTVSAPDHELLNGTLFRNCTGLKTLIFAESPSRLEFYNLCDLPKGLRVLKIVPVLILKADDYFGLRAFRRLQTLQLSDIRLQSARLHFHNKFVEALLRLRALSSLFVEFSEDFDDVNRTKTYCKDLNALLVTLGGRSGESFEEFRTLEVYTHPGHGEQPFSHFLDTDPLCRTAVEPVHGHGIRAQRDVNNNIIGGGGRVRLSEIIVNSNIYHRSAGPRARQEYHDVTLSDLCAAMYTLGDDLS